jgi:hypothetical protein
MPDPISAPREIARIVQHWLDHQDAERKREGLPTDDDTHLMTPPAWPNRGALKNWVSGLNGAADAIERLRQRIVETEMILINHRLRGCVLCLPDSDLEQAEAGEKS